jgi:hypothetical protein
MLPISRALGLFMTLTAAAASVARGGAAPAAPPSKVTFRPSDGIALVNGKPFFPLGVYLYDVTPNVLADVHEHRFNTVIGNGFKASEFDLLHDHGLMAVPFSTDENVSAVRTHPALLAWYLVDEPENTHTPEKVKAAYDHLKAKDADHPIGLCHYLWEGLAQFKGGCDFTMTDVYPVLAKRDGPIENVGKFVDEARRVHDNPAWPHWSYIQCFGGPDTEGGKWAQPLPHEVRCMTFLALAHRATGILYFSYWPKAPQTWASISDLNRDLERIVPWLLADGAEMNAKSDQPTVHVRAKKVGDGYLIIAVNHDRKPHDATLTIDQLGNTPLTLPFESRTLRATDATITDRFAPFQERVYLTGHEPPTAP